MELTPKHKKYLLYGGVVVAGVVIYSKMKAKHHEKKDKAMMPPAAAPIPSASQPPYDPLNLPSGGGYPSSYVPPYQPPYQPPYYPPTPIQYPYPTPTLPIQYPYPTTSTYPYPGVPPVSGYPGYPQYPAVNYVAACRAVIGLTFAQARSRLSGLGIYSQVVSINGKLTAAATSQRVGPVANLYLVYGRVSNATCSSGTSTIYPAQTPAVPYTAVGTPYVTSNPAAPTDTSTSVIPDGY